MSTLDTARADTPRADNAGNGRADNGRADDVTGSGPSRSPRPARGGVRGADWLPLDETPDSHAAPSESASSAEVTGADLTGEGTSGRAPAPRPPSSDRGPLANVEVASPYRPLRGRLVRTVSHLLETEWLIPMVRGALFRRLLGAHLGPHTIIESHVRITAPERLVTGEWVYVNAESLLDSSGGLVLEERVAIGPHVCIVTTTHALGPPGERSGRRIHRPVRIGRGSWLGARVTVLPGVTIGAGCIVGAGAVVNRDLAPNGLYVGNPARRVRDLPTGEGD